MMKREQVFEVIKKERKYQDKTWPRDEHPLVKQYAYAAPHIYLLEEYAAKTRRMWAKSFNEIDVLQNLGKMATIACRALQEIVPTHELNYSDVFIVVAINDERARQDAKHPRTKDNAGQYRFSAPHALLVEKYIGYAREDWTKGSRDGVMIDLIKIAAILVRALEEIEGSDLLEIGLR